MSCAAASLPCAAPPTPPGRLRAHYEKPPWRVIGKHLVCDAVQLKVPMLLLDVLVERVSRRVAETAENGAQRNQPKEKGERERICHTRMYHTAHAKLRGWPYRYVCCSYTDGQVRRWRGARRTRHRCCA